MYMEIKVDLNSSSLINCTSAVFAVRIKMTVFMKITEFNYICMYENPT